MTDSFTKILVTPQVAAAQLHYYGSAAQVVDAPGRDPLTVEEQAFIAGRDSFYLATNSDSGWPYIQHRGGPRGFLQVLDARTLAFSDYGGNRQLLSTGNLAVNDRVALFLMDYARRERLKILGHARVFDGRTHADLAERVHPAGFPQARPERIFVIDVVSYVWNCPKFITPRYTREEIQELMQPLQDRIAELEAQLTEAAGKPAPKRG